MGWGERVNCKATIFYYSILCHILQECGDAGKDATMKKRDEEIPLFFCSEFFR